MGWHSTWDKPEWNNEDLKYLLADLCNAVNERRAIVGLTMNFVTAWGETTTNPTPSDFVGLPFSVDASTADYKRLLSEVSGGIQDLFPKFWRPSFSEKWTFSDALAAVGSSGLSTDRWREKSLYMEMRSLLPLCRYVKVIDVPFSTYGNRTNYWSESVVLGGTRNYPMTAWAGISDNSYTNNYDRGILVLGFNYTGEISTGFGSPVYPTWYDAYRTDTTVQHDITYSGAASTGTLLGGVATLADNLSIFVAYTEVISGSTIYGTINSSPWEYEIIADPPTVSAGFKTSNYANFTGGTVTLNMEIPPAPIVTFYEPYPTISTGGTSELELWVSRIDAHYDMLSAFTFT